MDLSLWKIVHLLFLQDWLQQECSRALEWLYELPPRRFRSSKKKKYVVVKKGWTTI